MPVPDSPTPGFKQPTKAEFQYFLANLADFIERALARKSRPRKSQEYYEKNKDVRFREREASRATRRRGSDGAKPADDAERRRRRSISRTSRTRRSRTAARSRLPDRTKPPPPADGGKKKSSSTSVPLRHSASVALAQKSDDKTAGRRRRGRRRWQPAATSRRRGRDGNQPDGGHRPAVPLTKAPTAETALPATLPPTRAAREKQAAKPDVKYEPFEKVEDEIRKTLAGEKAEQGDRRDLRPLERENARLQQCSRRLRSQQGRRSRARSRPNRSTCRPWPVPKA